MRNLTARWKSFREVLGPTSLGDFSHFLSPEAFPRSLSLKAFLYELKWQFFYTSWVSRKLYEIPDPNLELLKHQTLFENGRYHNRLLPHENLCFEGPWKYLVPQIQSCSYFLLLIVKTNLVRLCNRLCADRVALFVVTCNNANGPTAYGKQDKRPFKGRILIWFDFRCKTTGHQKVFPASRSYQPDLGYWCEWKGAVIT